MSRTRLAGKWALWQTLVITGLVCCGAFSLWPPYGYPKQASARTACQSNIKQNLIAGQIYASDENDSLPPYFTFDGPLAKNKYVAAMKPYIKQDFVFQCPSIEVNHRDHPEMVPMEGVAGPMTYLHCHSLSGVIPGFSSGRRQLKLGDIAQDLAQIPYLRDPMVGNVNQKNPQLPILSPHGERFPIGYLDGHAKSEPKFDIARDL